MQIAIHKWRENKPYHNPVQISATESTGLILVFYDAIIEAIVVAVSGLLLNVEGPEVQKLANLDLKHLNWLHYHDLNIQSHNHYLSHQITWMQTENL